MPRPVDPSEKQEELNLVELSQIEPIRVVLDPASPSVRSIVRTTVVVLLFLFVGLQFEKLVGSLTYLFFLVVLSIFFAYLLSPLISLIRKPFKDRKIERFMPRPLAIVIAYFLVFSAVGITVASIAPGASEQARELGRNLPAYGASIQRTFNDLSRRFDRLRIPEEMQVRVNEQASLIGQSISTTVGTFFVSLVTFVPWLIVVPILSFFFLKDVNLFRLAVLRLFPAGPWRMRADGILADANETLAAYARAQILSCLLIGTVCTLAFYIIGLKYSLLLGVLAGIFEFVPLL